MTENTPAGRVAKFLHEWHLGRRYSGDIYGLQVGEPDREAILTASDLLKLVDHNQRMLATLERIHDRILQPFPTAAEGATFDQDILWWIAAAKKTEGGE